MRMIDRLYDLFRDDDENDEKEPKYKLDIFDDGYVPRCSNVSKLAQTSEYPISPYKAFEIASQNNNLKTNFNRIDERCISYLSFDDGKVKLITGDNGKKYYRVNITKGEISWVNGDTFYDGILCDDDFKILQCLIDAETVEYIFDHKNKKYLLY